MSDKTSNRRLTPHTRGELASDLRTVDPCDVSEVTRALGAAADVIESSIEEQAKDDAEIERLTRERDDLNAARERANESATRAEAEREAMRLRLDRYIRSYGPEPTPVETAGWRPIETAPKDGRGLLLGYFNELGKWRTLRGRWYEEGSMDEWDGDDGNNEAGWYEDAVEPDEPPNVWATTPTHWMPLPAPPQAVSVETSCAHRWAPTSDIAVDRCLDCDATRPSVHVKATGDDHGA